MRRYVQALVVFVLLTSLVLFGLVKVRAKSSGARISTKTQASKSARSQPKAQQLFAGFWRVDRGFESTLRVKNVLITQGISVSPVIYMADGTAYALPSIDFSAGAIHDLSVNQALDAAPPSVRGHLSEFGSVVLNFTTPSVMNVTSSMQILNAPQSLIFTDSSKPLLPNIGLPRGPQRLESIWWRHDPGVRVFVAVSNVAGAAMEAEIEVVGSAGTARSRELRLPAKGTDIVELDQLIRELPDRESQTGGVRITYEGVPGDLFASTGLVNADEGYSATSEFQFIHSMGSAPTSHFSFGSVGLMVGAQDPMMGFPSGTRFSAYAALRNTTDQPLVVRPELFLMQGSTPRKLGLPAERLAPEEAKQLSLASVLSNFNGMATLTFAYEGHPGDLLVATGSVDQTGTYVFEVMPNSLDVSWAKTAPFWSTAGGFDSMLTVFNPKQAPQDIVAKLTYVSANGPGHYSVPLHLAAGETRMLDVKDLIDMQQPDFDGNVIPRDVTEGSAQFVGPQGISQEIQIGASAGIFNVQTATCGGPCLICQTTTDAGIDPNPAATPFSGTQQATFTLTLSDGSVVDETSSSQWSSSNTSIATVQTTGASNPGLVSGIAIGSATLTALVNAPPEGPPDESCQSKCGNSTVTRQAPAHVWNGVLTPSDNFAGRSTTRFGLAETINLSFTSDTTAANLGGLQWSIVSGGGTLTAPNPDGTGTYTAPSAAASVVLRLTVTSGSAKGQHKDYSITIVAPSGAYLVKTSNLAHTQGYISVRFQGLIYLTPTDVSFASLKFQEGTANAVATGYFASANGQVHPAGPLVAISNCNTQTGCTGAGDEVGPDLWPPPFSTGDFVWQLPWQYQIPAGTLAVFTTATHHQTAAAQGANDGLATIEKAGAGPFSKLASDPTSGF